VSDVARESPDSFPYFDEDYEWAVLRLTWAVNRMTAARVLLCAAAEMHPREVPPPDVGGLRHKNLSNRFFLYALDIVISARRALQWFDDTAAGDCICPEPSLKLAPAGTTSAVRFVTAAFEAEPPAPAFIVPTEVSVPFAAGWYPDPRVRHLIAMTNPADAFTQSERSIATKWMEGETHVDFGVLPELWGSVHLIAGNPAFRSIRVRLERDAADRPSLVVVITPRTNRSVAGLQLLVEEERATGVGVLTSMTLADAITRIPLPATPGGLRERILDPKRGVLYAGHFGVFEVGFELTANLVTTQRAVAAPGPDEDAYTVPLVGSHSVVSRMEKRKPALADRKLRNGSGDRARRLNGESSQRWFRDRVRDGHKALRDVIGKVKSGVLICDSYFGGDDLRRVVLAIEDPRVPVRVLTSAKFLAPNGLGQAEHLARVLADVAASPPINPIEIRIMGGKEPDIHDRFLWLGDKLWMLGSSINRFGSRGTLMVVVPDHRPVMADLEEVWERSAGLDAWYRRKKNERANG
jgi:hypothetical protein